MNLGDNPRPWGSQANQADEMWDNLSPEKVREVVEQKLGDDAKKQAQAALPDEIEKFLVLHPEFDNSTGTPEKPNPNGEVMRVGLVAMGIDPTTARAEQFSEAYSRVKPLLKLKQHVVRGQQRQANEDAAKAIEAEIKETTFDVEWAESADLGALRERANKQLRARGW